VADVKIAYASSADFTITLASLATSSTWVAGREATSVSNTTNKYIDYLLSGSIMTGTTPTVNTRIEVWVVAKLNDSTWPDVFDGTDSAETTTTRALLESHGRLAASMTVTATSNVAYSFSNVSVASLFGGSMPKEFTVFVTHNTAVNLNSTGGNHVISHTGVYSTVA
jgi:hypothetical protein